jgi:hypothetical protein
MDINFDSWVPHQPQTWEFRYADLKEDMIFSEYQGHWNDVPEPVMVKRTVPKGTTVRIVMVSRFGDIGITDHLEKEYGYECRVDPDRLENYRKTPS